MATNPPTGDGQRKGAVRKRSQLKKPRGAFGVMAARRAAMPRYRFTTRLRKETGCPARTVKYPNDKAAIAAARDVLRSATLEAALERCLLDEEIEISDEQGALVALVTEDDNVRH